MKIRLVITFLAGVSAAAVGCGGGDGSSSCGPFTACGGDVVASWSIKQVCGETTAPIMNCQGGQVDGKKFKLTGTFTYRADMTYTETVAISGTVSATIPMQCLALEPGQPPLSCAQLQAFYTLLLSRSTDGMPSPVTGVTCTGTAVCSCSITLRPTTETETGIWKTEGNSLITTPQGSSRSSTSEYCVSGTALRLRDPPSMMQAMGSMGMTMPGGLGGPSPQEASEGIILVKQ